MKIDIGAYNEQTDIEAMKFSLRRCRSIATQPSLMAWGTTELFPGPDVGDSDEQLEDHIRQTTTTHHHQIGTCAIGVGHDAAVDPVTFRVHGMQGPRGAAATIMPQVITGNTNAPSLLTGEKVASAISMRCATCATCAML